MSAYVSLFQKKITHWVNFSNPRSWIAKWNADEMAFEWRTVFYISTGILFFGWVFFMKFGCGKCNPADGLLATLTMTDIFLFLESWCVCVCVRVCAKIKYPEWINNELQWRCSVFSGDPQGFENYVKDPEKENGSPAASGGEKVYSVVDGTPV